MKRERSLLFFLGMWLLSSCSHYQIADKDKTTNRLYPDGTYRHDITLELPQGKTQRFQGVVSLTPQTIVIVGLSAFGTTLFRITDKDQVNVEIFFEPLKKYEPKLQQFYRLLKTMLLLSVNGGSADAGIRTTDPHGRLQSMVIDDRSKTRLIFGDYDEHNVPLHVRVEREEFNVDVRVKGYEI